jgi:hypothetical protein
MAERYFQATGRAPAHGRFMPVCWQLRWKRMAKPPEAITRRVMAASLALWRANVEGNTLHG